MPPVLTPTGPGIGEGWSRLARAIRDQLPPAEIDGIWVFRTIRREARDWGTAILSRVDGERRRIYTARFTLTVKGRTRGTFDSEILEAGSGPLEALEELLGLVPKRSEDEEPPARIPVTTWFPPAEQQPRAEEPPGDG